jgi:hypothetical protein
MRTKILIVAALAAFAAPSAVRAQDSAGGEAFEFLLLDADARATGMGGAYTSLASDANAMRYNPAGLGRVRSFEATVMHNQYLQDTTHDYLSLASPYGFGFSATYFRVGDISRTTLAQPTGAGLNRFDVGDMSLGVGYGHTFFDHLSLGAGFKYIRQQLDTVEARVWAIDVGGLYTFPDWPGLTVGASALNIGPDPDFQQNDEKLPLVARAGASYAFKFMGNKNTMAFDMIKPRTDQVRFGLAGETVFAERVAFRLGVNTSQDSGLGITGGVGWISPKISVNYAILPMGDLGLSHAVSMTYKWGGPAAQPALASETPSAAPSLLTVEERFQRAEAAMRTGAFDQARAELGLAFGLLGPNDPRQVRYHERLGTIALRSGDVPKAKASYMEALRVAVALGSRDASVADAYTGMGLCLMRQKDSEYASRFFLKALEANPSPATRAVAEEQLRALKGR